MARSKGYTLFDSERCKGCGMCVAVCPEKIISLDESVTNQKGYHPAIIRNYEKCTGCCSCAMMCPDVAITVELLAA
ncbi:4Fe-4S binding protein [Desulforhopalus sp. 52FAK]